MERCEICSTLISMNDSIVNYGVCDECYIDVNDLLKP